MPIMGRTARTSKKIFLQNEERFTSSTFNTIRHQFLELRVIVHPSVCLVSGPVQQYLDRPEEHHEVDCRPDKAHVEHDLGPLSHQVDGRRYIEALQRRIDQHESGGIVNFGADMSDLSSAAAGRAAAYRAHGWTLPQRAAGDLAILWGQNANTRAMLL
ncbi:hypothetical protein B0H66DRAFT_604275 [Apodospora peruviana]|uniref:Uncharacterized protein n=1 Tax=Apodospora peruviana TaxID=516989 RepID=A0AAE0I1P1_9PEZI|nr:hypothetical protein B0H66DRAFT_604275 [Apodospora peruviana]